MAFVPGYSHDLFISYAHVNDLPLRINTHPTATSAPGWVATLVWYLSSELAQKIGRLDAFDVWLDQEALRGNHHVIDAIAAQLKSSATLIVVQSPAYLASIWCRDEARLFISHNGDQLGNRLFVVEKDR